MLALAPLALQALQEVRAQLQAKAQLAQLHAGQASQVGLVGLVGLVQVGQMGQMGQMGHAAHWSTDSMDLLEAWPAWAALAEVSGWLGFLPVEAVTATEVVAMKLPAVATSHPKQILQLVDQMQTQIQLDSHSWVCRVWSTVLGLLAALVLGALAVLVVVVLAKSEALRHLRQVIVVVETCHEVVKLPGMPRHEELEDFPGDLESEVSNQASSIWTMQEMASSAQCLESAQGLDVAVVEKSEAMMVEVQPETE